MDEELKQLLDAMRKENIAAHTETRQQVAETRQHVDVVAAETRRHFDVVAEDLRSDVRAVAEGVIANTQQIDALRSEMNERFSEVESLIKFRTHNSTVACVLSKRASARTQSHDYSSTCAPNSIT